MSNGPITVTLTQQRDYQFQIDFGTPVPSLLGDEPPPLGQSAGPSPMQLLCAAVGNCLSDSLLFALRKFKQSPDPLHCTVTADVGRNAENRLRVLGMQATLQLGVPSCAASAVLLQYCLNFCVCSTFYQLRTAVCFYKP